MLKGIPCWGKYLPLLAATTALSLLATQAAVAGEGSTEETIGKRFGNPKGSRSFLTSDAYRDGEEVVDVLLRREDYRRMVEDLKFGEVQFDWAWAQGDYRRPTELRALGFSMAEFATASFVEVSNHATSLEPGLESHVRRAFRATLEHFGLEVVKRGGDLEIGVAIVGYQADRTYVFFRRRDPFIELEIKLTHQGAPLLLIRQQEHGLDPRTASLAIAGELLKFLE